MRILGLDPSLSSTGWGVIEVENNRMKYVADGFIKTDPKQSLPERLAQIHKTLNEIIECYKPQEAAIEQVFLNDNPKSTIKLGMARGVVILAPSLFNIPVTEYEPTLVKKANIPVTEYEPTLVKKAVVGVGRAEKSQVEAMIKVLLSGCKPKNNDSSDALAMAITHNAFRKSAAIKQAY